MLKFATAQIIAAQLGEQKRVFRTAHRAVFDYEARPGYLYVRSRAISSRCNDNWDEFPAEEIEKAYRSFVGKPVFVNHVNDNHRRARGVIIDAALHKDRNPDGTPDTWCEVLMEVDAVRFPKLAKAILKKAVERTSMGCDVAYSICSACGNKATTPAEYCQHIPGLKGKAIYRRTASGGRTGEHIREICYGLGFFENSILVEPPADPTAHFLGVDDSGLKTAASKRTAASADGWEEGESQSWDSIGERHPHIYGDREIHQGAEDGDGEGIGWAANQLAHATKDDPDAENHGSWDMLFHSEHVDPAHIDHARHGADDGRVRHAADGYRHAPESVPPLVLVHRHGVYQVADGHHRAEGAKAAGAKSVRAYVAYSPFPHEPDENGEKAPYHGAEPHPGKQPQWDKEIQAKHASKNDPSVPDGEPKASDPRFDGVALKQDDDGFYVHTHRARSDSYPKPSDIPESKIEYIRSTGANQEGGELPAFPWDKAPRTNLPMTQKGWDDPRRKDLYDAKGERDLTPNAGETQHPVAREILDRLPDHAEQELKNPHGIGAGDAGRSNKPRDTYPGDDAREKWARQRWDNVKWPNWTSTNGPATPEGIANSRRNIRNRWSKTWGKPLACDHDHCPPWAHGGDAMTLSEDQQRRADGANDAFRIFMQGHPDEDEGQSKQAANREAGRLPVGQPFCRTCNQDLEMVWRPTGNSWQHAGGTSTGHAPVPHDGRTFNQEAHRQDEAAMWSPEHPQPNTAQPPRSARKTTASAAGLQTEAAGPAYPNPGDHPFFQQVPLHHDHILNHWDKATPEERNQGSRWYPDAHLVAKSIAKLHPDINDDAEAAHKGAGVLSAYSPQQNWWANQHNAARSFAQGRAIGKGEGLMVMASHAKAAQRIMDGEDHQSVLKGPKTADFAHLIEHAGNDEHGQPSQRVVVDRHALSVAAGRRLSTEDASGFPTSNRHYYEHAAQQYRTAAAVIGDREGRHVAPHEVQATTWLVRQRLNADEERGTPGGKGRQTMQNNQRQQWKDVATQYAPELGEHGNSHVARQLVDAAFIAEDGTVKLAYGETKAPADVDTLREENCPVCGDFEVYDGQMCQVCGFISPPAQFRDPNLDVAKQMDLRKQLADPSQLGEDGELSAGQGDPGEDGQLPQQGPDAVDPAALDENGDLPPSPYGDQALDGTQHGPAASDRNGDGMIQPNEIDADGNPNAQPLLPPEQGGPAAPQELPGPAQDRMGQPFTPGPNMPQGPGEPEGPEGMAEEGLPGTAEDGVPDLQCPACGFAADATAPQTQNMGDPNAAGDGVVAGDVCPNCQRAQLMTPGEMGGEASVPPPAVPAGPARINQ